MGAMMRSPLALLLVAIAGCNNPGTNPSDGGQPLTSPPVRSCAVSLELAMLSSAGSVQAGGEWNVFKPTETPLKLDNGTWKAAVILPPGDYGYKLVIDGTWQLDPQNPLRKWVGGVENSLLVVPDCRDPLVTFSSLSKSPDGKLHVEAQYADGSLKAGLDKVTALLDGTEAPVTVGVDGKIVFDATGLSKNKHRLSLRAADLLGRSGRDARLEIPFWIEDVPFEFTDGIMYFTFTDRFRDGDTSNNNPTAGVDVRANYQGGDFAGISAALDEGYFDALGVRSLWISPPNRNPNEGFPGSGGYSYTGYHGYWPSSGTETQPRFGTVDELKTLVKKAHARGIRVVVDSVLNHVHTQHPLYQAQRNAGWFNGDGNCVCGGPGCDWDNFALVCWFTNYLPDLNYASEDAQRAMIDDALYWADEVDVDGFRVDAVKHFLHAPTRLLRNELKPRFEHGMPLYYLVGETFTGGDDGGRQFIKTFVSSDELSAQFDFPIYWNVLGALGTYSQTMRDLEGACAATDATFGQTPMAPFFGNHDVARFVSQAAGMVDNDTLAQAWNNPPAAPTNTEPYERLRLALAFIYTQPGVPLVYYGDEYGQPGTSDPDNRRFMKWSGYSASEQATVDLAKKLGAARRELAALQRGTRATLWVDNDMYLYVRAVGTEATLVAINRGGAAFTNSVPMPAALVPFSDGTVLRDRLGGASVTVSGGALQVTVPPRTAAVWAP